MPVPVPLLVGRDSHFRDLLPESSGSKDDAGNSFRQTVIVRVSRDVVEAAVVRHATASTSVRASRR